MDAHSTGQSTSGLRRAAPVLPRNGLTVTRTRAGHDDVDLFVIGAGIRDSARILCVFTKKFLFGSKLRLRTTLMLCFKVAEAQYAVRSYLSRQNARSGSLAAARIAMTAVVEIAKKRRVGLAAEFARLDDFIRLAEAMAKDNQGSGREQVMDAAGAAPGVLLADRGHDADLISEDMAARDGVAVTATTIEEPATVEDGVLDVSLQSDLARNKAGEQAIDTLQEDSDQFAFSDEASVSEDELVLINPLSNHAFLVDVHVGQRIYRRRRTMGMTQQQLGDKIDVKVAQIQKYETGAKHISSRRMWDVAAALEVPMSYFFEGIEGQAPDTGEARGEVLTNKEALAPVRDAPRVRTVQAS